MGKKHKHLIERIADIENLRAAYEKTARGKRRTFGYLEFKEYAQANLVLMSEAILAGAWVQGPYREFTIYEPKARLISALDFKDRLAQHALVNVIGPIFEKTMLPQTFACRRGMGTHAGVKFIQASLRRTQARYYLKTDYSKFFQSIDRAVLYEMIERKVSCKATLKFIRAMVPDSGRGIPIGSLTSQLFANVYGNTVDRLIHFGLGHRHWARYMDDIVILDSDLGRLKDTFRAIEQHGKDVLKLNISKWTASPVSRGINFLGYRIWPTHKLLRKDSVTRAKRKIKRFIEHKETEALDKFLAAWTGHARWADTHNLITYLENQHALAIN